MVVGVAAEYVLQLTVVALRWDRVTGNHRYQLTRRVEVLGRECICGITVASERELVIRPFDAVGGDGIARVLSVALADIVIVAERGIAVVACPKIEITHKQCNREIHQSGVIAADYSILRISLVDLGS